MEITRKEQLINFFIDAESHIDELTAAKQLTSRRIEATHSSAADASELVRHYLQLQREHLQALHRRKALIRTASAEGFDASALMDEALLVLNPPEPSEEEIRRSIDLIFNL